MNRVSNNKEREGKRAEERGAGKINRETLLHYRLVSYRLPAGHTFLITAKAMKKKKHEPF